MTISLPVQSGIRIGFRFVGIVAPLLTSKLARIVVTAVLLLRTPLARPGLDQRAIHREMLVGQVRLCPRQYPSKELLSRPLPVEGRG